MKTFTRILLAFAATSATLSAIGQELFIYSNLTTQTGTFLNGGAANQSGNTITRLVADDITPLSGYAGQSISNIYFSVINNNAVAVSARPRLRMYDGTGAGGGPGAVIAGFTFNAISFAANSGVSLFFHPTGVNVPSGTFWIGLTFDNNTGATGATATQLNNLGMALFDPPTIGSSADTMFQTTAAGSHLVNNPVGTLSNFGGSPAANFYFGISVAVIPEPSSATVLLLGASCFAFLRRRVND